METSSPQGEKRKRASTLFPKNTLREVLRIAQSIQDINAGRPYNRLDLALSVGYSPESSGFRTLISSSSRYGLTEGGYQAETISLTPLGKQIVCPINDEERKAGLLKALRNIEIFDKILDHFNNSKLPKDDFLKNTLERNYEIPKNDIEQFLDIFKRNLSDWGLLVDMRGSIWLRLDKLSVESIGKSETTSKEEYEEETKIQPEDIEIEQVTPQIQPVVFISHSKNPIILEQIKQILDFGQFKYEIAEETETTSIPIPEKIFSLMRKCNCAIINISADEKEKTSEGIYRVNQNVLIEVGAAYLSYNQKVILLTDRRVPLPSNLQGLYRLEYEGEELTFSAALKLQKALSNFRDS